MNPVPPRNNSVIDVHAPPVPVHERFRHFAGGPIEQNRDRGVTVDDPATAQSPEHPHDRIGSGEGVALGRVDEQPVERLGIAARRDCTHAFVDRLHRLAVAEVHLRIRMDDQGLTVERDARQLLEPRHVVGGQSLEIAFQAAVDLPETAKGRSREGGRHIRETRGAEKQQLVVAEQAVNVAFVLQPPHQLDDPDPIGATVDEVPDEPESGILTCPVPGCIDERRIAQQPKKLVELAVDVTDHVPRPERSSRSRLRPRGRRRPSSKSRPCPCSGHRDTIRLDRLPPVLDVGRAAISRCRSARRGAAAGRTCGRCPR